MNLVDSCGWLEYFGEGANAEFFAPVLQDADRLLVPSVCILEVFKRVLQQSGENAALMAAGIMAEGHVVDLDLSIAMAAAKLSLDVKLPLADSVIVATARAYDAVVWTQDRDFASLDNVRYVEKR